MTKNELIAHVASETGMKKTEIQEVIETTLDTVKETVKNGDKVTLLGFGNFEPKLNKARAGINPSTKEKIEIKESNSVKFKAGKGFKDFLN